MRGLQWIFLVYCAYDLPKAKSASQEPKIRLQLVESGADPGTAQRFSERWQSLKRDLGDLSEEETDSIQAIQQALISEIPVALASISDGNNRVLQAMVLTTLLKWNQCDLEDGEVGDQNDYLSTLLQLCQNAIRAGAAIPTGTTYGILTADTKHVELSDNVTAKITELLFYILKLVCPSEIDRGPNPLTSSADLLRSYGRFPDCIEHIFGEIDSGLSVCEKCSPSAPLTVSNSQSQSLSLKTHSPSFPKSSSNLLTLSANKNTHEQTRSWREAFSLSKNVKFVPSLTEKPYAIVPIPEQIIKAQDLLKVSDASPDVSLLNAESSIPLPHPYETEILTLDWKHESRPEGKLRLYESTPACLFVELESTPLIYIEDEYKLDELISEINNGCSEIAIDLEHHSQFSYRGITCLIQISTRRKDYIIDPLPLKNSLTRLNLITANPKILKVFHGADSDILWLQKDFSVYVVNMFDTGQAARVLDIPGGASLANLLMYYCKVYAEKKYQLADWRQRPLPKEMVHYARSDTHYLLYIFDKMRTELIATNSNGGMHEVLERSRSLCLKCYEEAPKDYDHQASQIIQRHTAGLSPVQARILVELIKWRDVMAMEKDQSPKCIVATYNLIKIAEKVPRTWSELSSISTRIPRIIQDKAADILEIVKLSHVTASENEHYRHTNKKSRLDHQCTQQPLSVSFSDHDYEWDDSFNNRNQNSTIKVKSKESYEFESNNSSISSQHATTYDDDYNFVKKHNTSEKNTTKAKATVFSAVRKVPCPSSLMPADGFQVLLTTSEPKVDVSSPSKNIRTNGRLICRAIAKMISQNFPVPSKILATNIFSHTQGRKRQRD